MTRPVYFSALLLGALFGCSHNPETTTQRVTTTPPPVAPPPVAPLPPPAPAGRLAVLAPRPARVAHPRQLRRAGGVTASRPTTFRNNSAPALPDSGRTTGPGLFSSFAKAPQVFRINTSRDTVLYCPEGTILHVPATAFLTAADDRPATGLVEVRVREFYQLRDMVLANLTTTAGQELLETGGMLHLAAQTTTGQPCLLQPGAALLLQMPATAPQPGMQLYTGVATARHTID